MHAQSPELTTGRAGREAFHEGCPELPGKKAPRVFPTLLQFVAKVTPNDNRFAGWASVLQTGPDAEWITGDRVLNSPPYFPMQIGELMRAAGREVARSPDFAWLEDVVEAAAAAYADNDSAAALREVTAPIAAPGSHPDKQKVPAILYARQLRWALSDGYARFIFRQHTTNLVDAAIAAYTTAPARTSDDLDDLE